MVTQVKSSHGVWMNQELGKHAVSSNQKPSQLLVGQRRSQVVCQALHWSEFPEENADSALLGASGKPSRLGAAAHDEIFQKLEADSVVCDLVGKPSRRFMQEVGFSLYFWPVT